MSEQLHKHHILFHRKQHDAMEDNRWIRRSSGLIAPLPVDIHEDLHRNVPAVPAIDMFMARRVKGIMKKMGESLDPLDAIDDYCYAVEEASSSEKSYDIEVGVAEMAMEAIRMQIPYIKEARRGEWGGTI